MDYTDVERIWQGRVAELAARYEAQIVAMTLNHEQQLKAMQDELEKATNVEEAEGKGKAK